jgi:hypothetical protein
MAGMFSNGREPNVNSSHRVTPTVRQHRLVDLLSHDHYSQPTRVHVQQLPTVTPHVRLVREYSVPNRLQRKPLDGYLQHNGTFRGISLTSVNRIHYRLTDQ